MQTVTHVDINVKKTAPFNYQDVSRQGSKQSTQELSRWVVSACNR